MPGPNRFAAQARQPAEAPCQLTRAASSALFRGTRSACFVVVPNYVEAECSLGDVDKNRCTVRLDLPRCSQLQRRSLLDQLETSRLTGSVTDELRSSEGSN